MTITGYAPLSSRLIIEQTWKENLHSCDFTIFLPSTAVRNAIKSHGQLWSWTVTLYVLD